MHYQSWMLQRDLILAPYLILLRLEEVALFILFAFGKFMFSYSVLNETKYGIIIIAV